GGLFGHDRIPWPPALRNLKDASRGRAPFDPFGLQRGVQLSELYSLSPGDDHEVYEVFLSGAGDSFSVLLHCGPDLVSDLVGYGEQPIGPGDDLLGKLQPVTRIEDLYLSHGRFFDGEVHRDVTEPLAGI